MRNPASQLHFLSLTRFINLFHNYETKALAGETNYKFFFRCISFFGKLHTGKTCMPEMAAVRSQPKGGEMRDMVIDKIV